MEYDESMPPALDTGARAARRRCASRARTGERLLRWRARCPHATLCPFPAVPTLSDVTYDESLDDVGRCVTYSCSAIALQRLVHARLLADAASTASYAQIESSLLPLLEPLSNDDEYMVRAATAEQLPPLAQTLVRLGEEAGYQHVLDLVLPTAGRCVPRPCSASG